MKKCVIYSRVATSNISNPRESIDYQNAECKRFAQSQGYIVSDIFEDIAISGRIGILNRMDEVTNYCKENSLHTLIATDVTRLCRMNNELNLIFKKLNENNIQVIFARSEESLAMSMMIAQVQFQSEIHSQKIKAGLARKKLNL